MCVLNEEKSAGMNSTIDILKFLEFILYFFKVIWYSPNNL